MRIPRYWARTEGRTPANGRQVYAWGWSDDSHREAARLAEQRLTDLLDRVQRGLDLPRGYAYGVRPLREPILDELRGRDGDLDAVVTRNGYGSVVLNAARVLFADVDVPPATLGQRLASLVGSKRPRPDETILARVREVLQQDSGGSYRIYRTAAGFRILATSPLFTPSASSTAQLMERLGADPAFIQLCKVQESFRARLTPKPWRCGIRNPPGTHPRETPQMQADFAGWLADYERAAAAKATCRFVESIGWGRIAEEASAIVRLHDEYTRAASDLPLA